MGHWGTVLNLEEEINLQLELEEQAVGVTLFTDFKPNPGGQTRFFDLSPIGDVSDKQHRWLGAIGGIGCVAGETLINGVPIAERVRPDLVDTLLGQTMATAGYLKGQADLYLVKTRSGRQVTVTLDHAFLGQAGWVRLRDLHVGALIAADGSEHEISGTGRSKDLRGHCSPGSHPYGELPSPAEVAYLDKLQQLHTTACDSSASVPYNLLSIENSSQGFDSPSYDGQYLDAPNVCGSPHHRPQNFGQFHRSFHPQHSDRSLAALVDRASRHGLDSDPLQAAHHMRRLLAEQSWNLYQDAEQCAHNCLPLDKLYGFLGTESYESLPFPESILSSLGHGLQQHQKYLTSWLYCGNDGLLATPHRYGQPGFFAEPSDYQYTCTDDNSFWDEITDISFVRHDDFYDLHVPIHNHYSAHGLWHHNSGKTFCGGVWTVGKALAAPEARGLITANTFGQLARSTLIGLVEVCRAFNVPLLPYRESIEDQALAIANAQRCYIGEKKGFCYVLSMNSFLGKTQAARGLQVRYTWCDEAAFAPEQAFLTMDGRLGRGPGTMKGEGILTTSPAGFNWLYDRMADPNRDDSRRKLYVMVSVSTIENIKHLGADYVEGLLSNYTEELAAQELEGAFVNTAVGMIYKYFKRKDHALRGEDAEILAYDPTLPLHVSFDFNYSPAVCILAQQRKNEIHTFKEFFCLDSDTWELAALVTEFINDLNHESDVFIYGDATGKARTAASRLSNWDIVFNAFKDIGYTAGKRMHKRFDSVNPPVSNRINSVNCLLKQNRLYINYSECPQLIKDLECLTHDGSGIDKSDPLRSHLSDAWGYLIHKIYPFKAKPREKGAKQRPLPGIAA